MPPYDKVSIINLNTKLLFVRNCLTCLATKLYNTFKYRPRPGAGMITEKVIFQLKLLGSFQNLCPMGTCSGCHPTSFPVQIVILILLEKFNAVIVESTEIIRRRCDVIEYSRKRLAHPRRITTAKGMSCDLRICPQSYIINFYFV